MRTTTAIMMTPNRMNISGLAMQLASKCHYTRFLFY